MDLKIIIAAVLLLLPCQAKVFRGTVIQPESGLFEFWSLKPIIKTPPRTWSGESRVWGRNPIDHFITAKLAEKNLTYSGEAKRQTLIRRVYFDLLGLPPTPNEIKVFLQNRDPFWVTKNSSKNSSPRLATVNAGLVIGLTSSTTATRTGTTKGKLRPNAWPYRDYVSACSTATNRTGPGFCASKLPAMPFTPKPGRH
ncbi:MAG: hypothetical protein Ct9H300mP7_5130 [Verrucomicrobiota bacterium]|nr:MAG: hypothetical protein Ct9H300mP7_5130 [Verrucomicrobiota bacterium]